MKKPVMVVGGGIAGIQASTDLAEMGIPVFLVEKSPSIGGVMAQLDKTFPTNDCSACILAPKVTECFSHPLVKTLTLSDLKEIKGEAPHFTAVVERRPRYVDEDTCKGCDDCVEVCPVGAKSEFDRGLGERRAIYKPYPQAVPNKVTIDKRGSSPCKYNCPAKLDAHGYVTLIGEGRYEEALKVVRRTTPFAGVLGRVCLHPCEENCTRQFVEEPLSIASLKRFVADVEISQNIKPAVALDQDLEVKTNKIAIIGAGPAGINCAYQLALAGYQPTIFEKLPVAGGMLKFGIPDYRLDKSILAGEIQLVENIGVEIRLNTTFGQDFTLNSLKDEGFEAIFIAVGAHKDMRLGVPGEDHHRVISSVDFLRALNLGNRPDLGKQVVVIGGGNVAMDAARSARRFGCEVTVLYRRSKAEMPANSWEIHHAQEEGVKIHELATPVEVMTEDDKLIGLKCLQNEPGPRDASGRRSPVSLPNSAFVVPAETIIVAIGQKVDHEPVLAGGIEGFNRWGTLAIDDSTMEVVGLEGVFAGGDATRGPATMVEAVADGNRAAQAIRNYLEGTKLPIEPLTLPQTPLEEIDTKGHLPKARANMPMIPMEKRLGTFEEVEMGYTEEVARAEAARCVECSVCCECKLCEEACQSGAIRHHQCGETFEIPVSAVVLAPGIDIEDHIPPEWGYHRYADVVTSLEYERILSSSGPFEGHVQRPSDGREPGRIAFIQCVGSRDDQHGGKYCSAVCCMYAVKEAQITKEHLPTVEQLDIFYMDMRSYGKDFDRYVEAAKNKYNINFIRSRIGGIRRDEATGELLIQACGEEGWFYEKRYDMVVLSVGIKPNKENVERLGRLGVKTDRHGFIATDTFQAPETSRFGIFACGAAAGPKDIPESVVEASAAAASAAKIANPHQVDLYKDYATFFVEEPEVPERDVSKEPIRIGVFVCHCGVNIGGYLDVEEVVEHSKALPFVVFSEASLYTCSVDAQKTISEKIEEYQLNRVVVASCTPRTHEPLFQSVLRRAGLNPYLLNMANIRDQCSWVHMNDRISATAKAIQLVTMAVAKVTCAKPLKRKKINVDKAALVIGGGMAGLSAARELSGMGYLTYLVEKSDKLGGRARHLIQDNGGRPLLGYFQSFIQSVEGDPNIVVMKNSNIVNIDGYVGNFHTLIDTPMGQQEMTHGVVIVATGAQSLAPHGFLYGKGKPVFTHPELEKKLEDKGVLEGVRDLVMIQCVNSRDEDYPYCSRVCCMQAIRNAIRIKTLASHINVTILYREIRSYGTRETYYRQARKQGVSFVRFKDDDYPVVEVNGKGLVVRIDDPLLGKPIEYLADILSLSANMSQEVKENTPIARMLKVPLNEDGFFLEAHVKLRPVDFATEGVYLAGLAHSPKDLKESIIQGKAAAGRAATVIAKEQLQTEGTIAKCDQKLCVACGACEQVCAYKAVEVQQVEWRRQTVEKAVVNDVLCKGCGTCAASCRSGAIDIGGYSDMQIINEIEYLLRGASI